MDHQLKKILLWICGVLFLVSSLIVIPFVIKDSASRNWPLMSAKIQRSEVQGKHLGADDPLYILEVKYAYKVGDQTYTASNYGTHSRLSSKSEKEMIDLKKEYPAGSRITIAFNPKDPGDALMNPGMVWYHWIGLGVVGLFGLCFLICFLVPQPYR